MDNRLPDNGHDGHNDRADTTTGEYRLAPTPRPLVPQPATPPARRSLSVWQAIGFMALGSFLTLCLIVISIMLFLGTPPSKDPLTPPTSSGKPDLTARVNQEYVNNEIANLIKQGPITFAGVAEVRDVKVQFLSNSLIQATARVNVLGRQLDFQIQDNIFVKESKIALSLKGDVKLLGGSVVPIPVGVLNNVADRVNSEVITDQLNRQLQNIGKQPDCNGKTLGRTPTLLALNTEPGALIADFRVIIETKTT